MMMILIKKEKRVQARLPAILAWRRLLLPHMQIKEHRCPLGFPEARVIVLDSDRRDECEMIYGFSLQHEKRPFDRLPSFLHIP